MKPKEQISLFTLFPKDEKPAERSHETKNGYAFDEVTSAIQKAIRRGQEEEALYWAYELVDGGAWNYLFKRLRVIAAEDIGLADPQAAILTNSVYTGLVMEWARRQANDQKWFSPDMNIIGMVVMYLVRAPKNRVCDIKTTLIWEKRKAGWKLEVPDYSVDQHTTRGKARIKKEGIDSNRQFYSEGAQVKNRVRIDKDQDYWDQLMELYGLDDLIGKETEKME